MTYKFTIPGRLEGLNDYIKAGNKNRYVANDLKQEAQEYISWHIKSQLKNLKINKQININYVFYEPNRKRDKDGIASFAMKVVQDALVVCEVIKNDGWRHIKGFACDFEVDRTNPRIEVTLEEVGD